jgi:hypothetical protein
MHILDNCWCYLIIVLVFILIYLVLLPAVIMNLVNKQCIDCYDILTIILIILIPILICRSLFLRIKYLEEDRRFKLYKKKSEKCTTIESMEDAALEVGYSKNHRLLKYLNKAKKCTDCECLKNLIY